MARTIITFHGGQKQVWRLLSLQELSPELKGILTVPLKELIDELGACEDEWTSMGSVQSIRFLDDCYRAA